MPTRRSTPPQGDHPALRVERYLPTLRAFFHLHAGPLLRTRESLSDLVQSTCREACAQLDNAEFRDEDAFRAWLFTLARNKINSRYRYHLADKRHPGREEQHLDPRTKSAPVGLTADLRTASQDAMLEEDVRLLERAFDRLPDDYREVIILARFDELSHAEIARHVNRTPKGVRNLLHRAMVRLTTEMTRMEQAAGTPPPD